MINKKTPESLKVKQLTEAVPTPEEPFGIQDDGVQVAGLGKTLGAIVKGSKGTKDIEKIAEGVHTRKIPAVTEDQALDVVTTPPRPVEMGRPSAVDPVGRNINFDNLNTSDDILQLIDDVGVQNEQFIKARGGVVSHEETIKAAGKYSIEDLLGRKPGEAFNAAQVTSARTVLIESAERIQSAAKIINEGAATEADMLSFRQMVAQHSAIQSQVSGMTAEAGKALNAFKIQAEEGMVKVAQMRDALGSVGGMDSARKLASLIADAENPAEVAKIARDMSHATSSDMILEYWINGLLSSPATHAVNMTSNAMVGLWQVPERLLAAGFGKIMRTEDGVKAGEVVAQLYGMGRGMKDGLRLFAKTIRTGEPSDPALKLETHKYKAITADNISEILSKNASRVGLNPDTVRLGGVAAQGADLLGAAVRLPGRFLTAEDELFKSIGYRMELNALAYRQAVGEGLEGNQLASRINDVINNPPEQLHLAAIDAGRYQTFTKPLGDLGQAVQAAANAHPAAKLLLPFIRTPVNIVKYAGERSPLAPLSKVMRAEIAAGGARRDLAMARISMGSMIMVASAELASTGMITGGGPDNKGVRNAMRRQGWQPYSLKVDDTYYSFNRLDPIGMLLGISADVVETMKYAETDDEISMLAATAALSVAKNLTSRIYLRSLSEFMEAIDDPDRYMERYIRRQAATFTPMTSLTAQIERQFDPTQRASYDLISQIRSRTPGLSESLPPRRNLWGAPIVLQGGLGWDMVSPIYTSTEKESIADDEIIDNQVSVSMPSRVVGSGHFSTELTPEEYDRYVVLAGSEFKEPNTGYGLKEYLEKEVIASDLYQNGTRGPDGMRAMVIRTTITKFRQAALMELKKEFPGLASEIQHQAEERAGAVTGLKQGSGGL